MGGTQHEAALVIAYCQAVAKKHRSRSDPQSWMNFVTDVVKQCITYLIIDRNMEETKKFKSDMLISVFTDGFIKKYSLVNSHIGNFDMFL